MGSEGHDQLSKGCGGHFSVATKKDAYLSVEEKNDELIFDPCTIYCHTQVAGMLQESSGRIGKPEQARNSPNLGRVI